MDNALTLGLIISLPLWTVACIGIGFRMGRKTAGQTVTPLIPKSKEKQLVDEDPYFEAMHGTKQPRIPIGDEK